MLCPVGAIIPHCALTTDQGSTNNSLPGASTNSAVSDVATNSAVLGASTNSIVPVAYKLTVHCMLSLQTIA